MSVSQKNLQKILKSSAKMGVATLTSRVLGLVREQTMAAAFGASGLSDAFLVAYRVPNLLRDLFAEGAFSSAFVPVFTEVLQVGEREARRLLWSLVILLGAITSLLSLLIIWFAPEIIQIFTDQAFSSDEKKFATTIILTRIMAPFLVLISLAALFMGALNSVKIFFIPALAPAFFNIVMILSIIFTPQFFRAQGLSAILGAGVGVLLGGLAQLLLQLPLIFRKGLSPLGPLKFISPSTKKIVNRVGLGTIGIAATQINLLVTTILATGTVVGAVSWLTYAFRLFQFPVGILSVSIAGSNLVHFSEAWKKGQRNEAISFLQGSYTLSWFVIVPAFALLFGLKTESVHLIFEHGAFSSHDTAMTAMALKYYLYGLFFYGPYKIFAPTFFAIDRPKVPIFLSVVTVACNIIFCLIFTPLYGLKILALGTSLSMLINTFLQGHFLCKYLKLPLTFYVNGKILKAFVGGVVAFALTEFLRRHFFFFENAFMVKILVFCGIGCMGAFGYVLTLITLGEWNSIRKIFKK